MIRRDYEGGRRLRLLKVVEDGPLGRSSMSSRVSFDSATWHGDTVPRIQGQAVSAPGHTPGDVPSFFASLRRIEVPKWTKEP